MVWTVVLDNSILGPARLDIGNSLDNSCTNQLLNSPAQGLVEGADQAQLLGGQYLTFLGVFWTYVWALRSRTYILS